MEEETNGLRRLEGGSGRERSSLPVEERKSKALLAAPLGARQENCSDDERQ